MFELARPTVDRRAGSPGWHGGQQPVVEMLQGVSALLNSTAMRELFEQVRRFARTGASVLIMGESGTGKELVARAVHQYSARSARPFLDFSCAALPEHLAESELFGYERGAFSGANASKPGYFEMAGEGSLFLDEIGELDLKMQAKLLRVLDGTSYFRLGGTRKIVPGARVIAATNRSLEVMVAEGTFRADLYHRLSAFPILIPALRERRDDIAPLAEFFLAQNRPDMSFSPGAMAAMVSYRWPGNVRELKNLVWKTSVLSQGPIIEVQDLPANLHSSEAENRAPTLEGIKRKTILQALRQSGGHQARAAEVLGISRRTLTRRLKEYSANAA